MKPSQRAAALLACAVMSITCAACRGSAASSESQKAIEKWGIDELVIVLLPGEDTPEVMETRNVFDAALSDYLGIPVTEYHATDYTAVVEAMRTGHAQVANFGPFSYVHAVERAGAECFAVQSNNGTSGYYSLIITRKDSGIVSLDDLEGRTFGFVDPESTSGNVVPTDMILGHFAGKHPDLTFDDLHVNGKFFASAAFTGNHSNSVQGVFRGDVDAAGVASQSYASAVKNGLVNGDEIIIVAQSPLIPASPFAIQKDLKPELKAAVAEFFLTWDNQDFWAGRGQKEGDHYAYISVDDSTYDYVRELRDKYGLSD